MKKEELMKIEGMTEEMATKIAEASAEELKGFIPKSRFDEVNEAKKNAEALVKERDTQLDGLKKASGDADGLKKQIEELQKANETAKGEYEARIKQMKIDSAVESALMGAKALNTKAARALLKDLDKAEFDDSGAIKGLAEQIKALQSSDAYLFGSTDPAGKFTGATPGGASGGATGTMTKAEFDKLGYASRVELFNTNRELYNKLAN